MSESAKAQRRKLRQERLEEFLLKLDGEGMTQREVAQLAGVPPQYLNDVKAGRRPLGELLARRLHEKFAVDYLWLLGKKDQRGRSSLAGIDASGIPFTALPIFAHPIEGEPRRHKSWKGSVIELVGVAATRTASCEHPYVLRFGAEDRRHRLHKNDLLLISQKVRSRCEIHVIKLGSNFYLARYDDQTGWERVAPGETISGEPTKAGWVVGIIWASL